MTKVLGQKNNVSCLSLIRFAWILPILFYLSSCTSVRYSNQLRYLKESNCNQQNFYTYNEADVPHPIHELDVDSALLSSFSFESLNMANAIGMLGMIEDLAQYIEQVRDNPTLETQMEILKLSQNIQHKIHISSLEISAVASELDCEEERIEQIANYLKNREDKIDVRLTSAAIVIGAAGAITAGFFLRNGRDAEIVGISTAVVEATLGFLMLANKKKILFHHPRNALTELWEGHTTSSIFPPSVWYYLNYFNPEIPERKSSRYEIIDGWMDFEQVSKVSSTKKRALYEIYFGDSGRYTSEQLYNRANMYDQLESYIKLMKQDLMKLAVEVESVKNKLL